MKRIAGIVARAALVVVVVIVSGAAVGVLRVDRPEQPPATTAYNPSLPNIEVDGYRFHGEVFEPGVVSPDTPDVIVLHGGPGGDYRYLLDLRDLADTHRVVFYDQRGAGLSPRVDAAEMTVERHVADLDAIIAAVAGETGQVDIIGHSWGAMLGTAYISAHPDRVRRAVLAEPGFLTREAYNAYFASVGSMMPPLTFDTLCYLSKTLLQLPWIRTEDGDERRDFLVDAIAFGYDYRGSHPLGGYYRDGSVDNAEVEKWRLGGVAATAVGNDADSADALDLSIFTEHLDLFTGPVLLVSSEYNTIIGTDFQRRYHVPLFRDVEFVEIAGAGHSMIGEQPEESLRVIREFLAR